MFNLSKCLLCQFRCAKWEIEKMRQILDSSKLKEFAADNLEFNEKGKEVSKRVEKAVGKGEIARDEQFLLSPQ